jgi:4-amino-4-deoxy-L-arabinose transferase-like glycosyltransferase
VWFGTLDERRLVRPDEGRYAEVPREMVASGDWVTPRLNAIKYFEKPALQYWATAITYEVFGEHQWSARLWPALTGFFGIVLTWYVGRRLWGARVGALSAAILASSMLYLVMSQVITLDMGLSFFLQLTWTSFLFAQHADARNARRWMWLAWIALALAMLTKGLVALVLTGGTLFWYSLVNRDASPWRRLNPVSGLLLFAALVAPWFVAVSVVNPEFAHFFFIHEHFERFLTTVHRRDQPGWYFFAVYLLGALPWTFMLLHALLKSWKREAAATFQPQRFLLLWIVITFVFFSISSSKLPSYILPIFPALALLGGKWLSGVSRTTLMAHLAALLLIALPARWFAPHLVNGVDHEYTYEMLSGYATWLTAAATIWLLALVAASALTWTRRNTAAVMVLAVGSMLAGLGALLGHDHLAPYYSAHDIAAKVRPLMTPDVPFYSVRGYEQTLPFYLKRTVTLVEYTDELAFGLAQEPDQWIPTVAEFRPRWDQAKDAFAIMPLNVLPAMQAENLPMQEIARDQRNVIIRKPQ